MPNQFGDQQIQNANYWYEKLPYTFSAALQTVQNAPIFQVSNVGTVSSGQKMAIISDIAPNAVAGVNLNMNTESDNQALITTAFPGNLTPDLTAYGDGFRSTANISMSPQNETGAVIANYQMNYSAAVKRLTTADKIMRGLALTARDQELQAKYNIGKTGLRPPDLEDMLRTVFRSQIIGPKLITFSADAIAGMQTPVSNLQTVQDEVLIITSIAASTTAGNGVTLNIDRDGQIGYVSVLVDNMSLSNRFNTWIPVKERMGVTLTANATTATIVNMTVLRLRFSKIIQFMFGVTKAALTAEDQVLMDEIEAGVLV